MDLNKIGIRIAPLSNRIVLARLGKDPNVALDTCDIMSEFWQALVQYSFDGRMPEKGEAIVVDFGGGDEQFTCTVARKLDTPVVPHDAMTGRPFGDHGTGTQAIDWALEHADSYTRDDPRPFFKAWLEGDAFHEWPEFYDWLNAQK